MKPVAGMFYFYVRVHNIVKAKISWKVSKVWSKLQQYIPIIDILSQGTKKIFLNFEWFLSHFNTFQII